MPASSLNQRLTAIRKLAAEAADNGLIDPTTAQAIAGVEAILAVLLGCGLRREEAARLEVRHLQQREGRWVIVDLIGKRNKTRSVPMPNWTKASGLAVPMLSVTPDRVL